MKLPKQFEILREQEVFSGFLRVVVRKLRYQRYDGAFTQWLQREIVVPPNEVVACLLVDRKRECFVFVEQFRVGAIDSKNPWLTEIVAGYIDATDDSPEKAVAREVLEETGLEITNMIKICSYWVSPGETTDRLHLYCADVDADKAPEYAGMEAEQEDIHIVKMSFDDCWHRLAAGGIDNAMSLIALQWYQLTQLVH